MHLEVLTNTCVTRHMDAGKKVEALRKRFGLTQDQVSAMAGFDRTVMPSVKSGRNKGGGLQFRQGIARVFGLKVDDVNEYLDGLISLDEVAARATVIKEVGAPDRMPAPKLRLAPSPERTLGSLPEWADLIVDATRKRPDIQPWVWKRVAKDRPIEGAPLTAETIIEMALLLMRLLPATYEEAMAQVPPTPSLPPQTSREEDKSRSREMPAPTKPPKHKRR